MWPQLFWLICCHASPSTEFQLMWTPPPSPKCHSFSYACTFRKAKELTRCYLVAQLLLLSSPHPQVLILLFLFVGLPLIPQVPVQLSSLLHHPHSHLQKKSGFPLSISLKFPFLCGSCFYFNLIHSVGSWRPWHFIYSVPNTVDGI